MHKQIHTTDDDLEPRIELHLLVTDIQRARVMGNVVLNTMRIFTVVDPDSDDKTELPDVADLDYVDEPAIGDTVIFYVPKPIAQEVGLWPS